MLWRGMRSSYCSSCSRCARLVWVDAEQRVVVDHAEAPDVARAVLVALQAALRRLQDHILRLKQHALLEVDDFYVAECVQREPVSITRRPSHSASASRAGRCSCAGSTRSPQRSIAAASSSATPSARRFSASSRACTETRDITSCSTCRAPRAC